MNIKEYEAVSNELTNLKNTHKRLLKHSEDEDDLNLKFFFMGSIYALENLNSILLNSVDWSDKANE